LLALRLRDIERFGGDWRQAIDHVEKVPAPVPPSLLTRPVLVLVLTPD
jgi:hypothetical protein